MGNLLKSISTNRQLKFFAGINFRESTVIAYFAGINFREFSRISPEFRELILAKINTRENLYRRKLIPLMYAEYASFINRDIFAEDMVDFLELACD